MGKIVGHRQREVAGHDRVSPGSAVVPGIGDRPPRRRVLRLVGTATTSGVVTNVATATSAAADPTPATTTAVQVIAPRSAIEVSKAPSVSSAEVGRTIEWVVRVTNRGPDVAADLLVVERPGVGLLVTEATPNIGTFDIATGHWTIPSLGVGATGELRVATRIASEGSLSNAVSVSGANLDQQAGSLVAQASITGRQPSAGGGGILAFTGANAGLLLTIGLVLVAGGAASLLISRRSDDAS